MMRVASLTFMYELLSLPLMPPASTFGVSLVEKMLIRCFFSYSP